MTINDDNAKKKTRRANGEGTYYEYTIGDKPYCRWRTSYVDRNGKTQTVTLYASSKKEIQPKIKKWKKEIEEKQIPEYHNITLSQWLDKWLDTLIKPNSKARTYDNYFGVVTNYLQPTLGKYQVKHLTGMNIQMVLNQLQKTGGIKHTGLSLKTVHNTRMVLKMALYKAIAEGIITVNPVNATKLPSYNAKEIIIPTQKDVEKLLSVAHSGTYIEPDTKKRRKYLSENPGIDYLIRCYYMFIWLAVTTSARPGELLALSRSDVDLNNNIIHINGTLVHSTSGGTYIGTPKTKNSKRDIIITGKTVKKLKQWLNYQAKYAKQYAGVYTNTQSLVLSTSFGGFISPSNFRKRAWEKMLTTAGLKYMRLYDLRHFAISTELNANVNNQIVAKRSGHSVLTMYKTYAHIIAPTVDPATQALEKLGF